MRHIDFWGSRALPQRMRRHGTWHRHAEYDDHVQLSPLLTYNFQRSYWAMYFDTSPQTLQTFNSKMRGDPRVVKWTMIKLGHRPEDTYDTMEKTIERPKRDDLKKQMEQRLLTRFSEKKVDDTAERLAQVALSALGGR